MLTDASDFQYLAHYQSGARKPMSVQPPAHDGAQSTLGFNKSVPGAGNVLKSPSGTAKRLAVVMLQLKRWSVTFCILSIK
jgi:hypothetical protein